MRFDFEWDERKNRENLRKHKIAFEDAQRIFDGPVVVHADIRVDYGEERWIATGQIGGRTVVVVFRMAGPERLRIISARKALRWEREQYEETIAKQGKMDGF